MSEREAFDAADEAWLFDAGRAPAADSARIERLLALQRRAARPTRRSVRARAWPLAAAALLLAALGAAWFAYSGGSGGYRVWRDGGSERLRLGERLAVGSGGARLEVPGLGHVSLEEGADFSARAGEQGQHRFFLARGTLEATITAEPGAFGVDTPAGSSVDLGCLYRLAVDERGDTRLAVQIGRVAFTHAGSGREVYVPAGASCEAFVARGPHSPAWDSAALGWRELVARLDFDPEPDASALAEVRSSGDTLALWHLLEAAAAPTRAAAYDRLAELEAPPAGVERALVVDTPPGSDAADAARLAWLERMDWFTYAF